MTFINNLRIKLDFKNLLLKLSFILICYQILSYEPETSTIDNWCMEAPMMSQNMALKCENFPL